MKYSAERDRSRASAYGMLAKLFDSPPSAEMLIELRKAGLFAPSSGSSEESLGGSWEIDREDLDAEYTRLFLGPGPHVSPFASVYRKDENGGGELWGNMTGEVRRFMEHYGLSLNKSGAIPDHIAILFEFMERFLRAKLLAAGAGSTKRSEREEDIHRASKVEKQFFNRYIDCWVDDFLDEVEKANPHPFYSMLIEQTRSFVAEERKQVNS
jgi:TorA maturation chaperone TorD